MKKTLIPVNGFCDIDIFIVSICRCHRSGTWVGTWRTESPNCQSIKNTTGNIKAILVQGSATNSPNPYYVTFASGTLTLNGFPTGTTLPDFSKGAQIVGGSIGDGTKGPYDTHVSTGSINFQGGYMSYYENPTKILQIQSPSYTGGCGIVIEHLLLQSSNK